jgi:DNA-binding response OmpR family regulator
VGQEESAPSAHKVLVVEDDFLIAMELERTLLEEGYDVLGPVTSVALALALLGRSRPDAAVLDVNLRGEKITPVARVLKNMDVPFILSSGYEQATLDKDPALAEATNIGKPAAPKRLLTELAALLEAKTR